MRCGTMSIHEPKLLLDRRRILHRRKRRRPRRVGAAGRLLPIEHPHMGHVPAARTEREILGDHAAAAELAEGHYAGVSGAGSSDGGRLAGGGAIERLAGFAWGGGAEFGDVGVVFEDE